MASTASSPEGNNKNKLVKSVTVHGGKCLQFLQMLSILMWGPKWSRGGQGEMESIFKMTVLQTHCSWAISLAHRQHSQMSPAQRCQWHSGRHCGHLHWDSPPKHSIRGLDKTCYCWQALAFCRERERDGDEVMLGSFWGIFKPEGCKWHVIYIL